MAKIALKDAANDFGTNAHRWGQTVDAENVRVLTMEPIAAGKAPFALSIDNTTFLTTPDPIMAFGYNFAAGGNALSGHSTENSLALVIEADYNDGTTDNKMEAYIQYALQGVASLRPLFIQINRDTHAASVTVKGEQFAFAVPTDLLDGGLDVTALQATRGQLVIHPPASGATDLNVKAVTSGKARLRLGYNAVDDHIVINQALDANSGAIEIKGLSIYLRSIVASQAHAGLAIGETGGTTGALHIKTTHASVAPLWLEGATNQALALAYLKAGSGQTGALTEWRDSANAAVARVSLEGYLKGWSGAALADALVGAATKTTAGAPYANDGYIEVQIAGTTVRLMTTA